MKRLSEGRKMFVSIMAVFVVYAVIFLLFEDYDRRFIRPFSEASDWHLLVFSIVVVAGLGWLLHGYACRMDERITREQQEQRSQMRRELTQNIAHELKTPVASILGYMDTILGSPNMDQTTKDRFISRAHAQAVRLTALLQDISMLTKMDYAPHVMECERVDISALVADIIQESAHALAERQMTFRNCLPPDVCVYGNWQLIYGIFRNLTDNAISYAGRSATVELTAQRDDEEWHFCFSDNGVGVPEEHLARLFERFYRVDKGRSRDMGGTGLGLSIVKNAVLLHGGAVEVGTPAGGGLQVSFSLPLCAPDFSCGASRAPS